MSDDVNEYRLGERYGVLISECTPEVGPGWLPIIHDLARQLERNAHAEGRELKPLKQVKQKFGELRVYHPEHESDVEAVREAELRAQQTCENCGMPGRKRELHRYFCTLCDACYRIKACRF